MELAEESGTTSYQSHLASKAPQFWKKKRELPNLGLRDKAKSLIQILRSKNEKSSKIQSNSVLFKNSKSILNRNLLKFN